MKQLGEIIWSIGFTAWVLIAIIGLFKVNFNFKKWLYNINIKLWIVSCIIVWIGIILILISNIT